MSLGMLEILRGGGFTTGGLNFDSKLRRQSIDRNDLFHAHVGGIDTMAHALVVAASILDDGSLDTRRDERYSGWSGELGQSIIDGKHTLATLRERALADDPKIVRASGQQEQLENLVARHIDLAR
jgi:xylose isomerase